MEVIRQGTAKIVDFDDDRKTKIGSAMLVITISPESWSSDQAFKYKATLKALGWIESNVAGGGIFLCKHKASALIMDYRAKDQNGYLYMKYPSDPRAMCGK